MKSELSGKELIVIIPARNEEDSIWEVLEQLDRYEVREYADVLVIDDSSTDNTKAIVKNYGYELIENKGKKGYGSTLQAGYKYAVERDYKFVLQMDADGQHDACNILPIYTELKYADEPADIVLGSRFMGDSVSYKVPGIKRWAIRFFERIIRLFTGQTILDPTTGLQGLNRRAFEFYARDSEFDSRYPDADMLIKMLRLGFKIKELPAVMHERKRGKSMYVGVRPCIYMLHMVFSIFKVLTRHQGGTEKYAIIFPEKQMEL